MRYPLDTAQGKHWISPRGGYPQRIRVGVHLRHIAAFCIMGYKHMGSLPTPWKYTTRERMVRIKFKDATPKKIKEARGSKWVMKL